MVLKLFSGVYFLSHSQSFLSHSQSFLSHSHSCHTVSHSCHTVSHSCHTASHPNPRISFSCPRGGGGCAGRGWGCRGTDWWQPGCTPPGRACASSCGCRTRWTARTRSHPPLRWLAPSAQRERWSESKQKRFNVLYCT